MKSDTLRELLVALFFASFLFALLSQFVLLRRGLIALENGGERDGGPAQRHPDTQRPSAPIHVGMIVKNVGRAGEKSVKLKDQFAVVLTSILRQRATHAQARAGQAGHTRRSQLHFVIFSDAESVPYVRPILRNLIDRFVAEDDRSSISFDFFDVSVIADRFGATMAQLRPYFTSTSQQSRKYTEDLFMIAIAYHRVFPFDKLIMLDIDLLFKIDIEELYRQFDFFDEQNIIGVGLDLSVHYHHVLRFHRQRNPNTDLGTPGRFQGFNTGVVLFDLRKMRNNNLYLTYANNSNDVTAALADRLQFRSHLGDQCFFTLLGLEFPQLFYVLPCEFNFQLDTGMCRKEWVDIFAAFHNCTAEAKIVHANGGVEMPFEDVLSVATTTNRAA